MTAPAAPRAAPSPLGLVPAAATPPLPSGGLFSRIGAAWKAFQGPVFSPSEPMQPPPESQALGPRQFQYRSGYNLNLQPRSAEGLTPFDWLVSVAELYDTLQMAIAYRQEEMMGLDWAVVAKDEARPPSQAQLSDAQARLARPDGVRSFAAWLAAAMWEVLVTDALSIYPEWTKGGAITGFSLVDGATIKPVIDARGRIPTPPLPAYQQILWGRPMGEWDRDRFLYAPKNQRPKSAYGRSPVEMLVLTINRALRRQQYDLTYYTAGNVPEAIMPAPADWGPDQIEQLQSWFDTIVSQPERRRNLHFVPTSTGRMTPYEFKKPILDTVVEEFLDKRVFAMIGVPPQELGMTADVNRSTSQGQENTSQRRQKPFLRYFSGVFTRLLELAGDPDCKLQFAAERPEEDKLMQAQVDDYYLKNGVYSVDDIHKRQGATTEGQRYLYLATGPVPFPPNPDVLAAKDAAAVAGAKALTDGTANPPRDAATSADGAEPDTTQGDGADVERQLSELDQWARRLRKHGTAGRPFVCRSVPADIAAEVAALLGEATDVPAAERQRIVFAAARELVRSGGE